MIIKQCNENLKEILFMLHRIDHKSFAHQSSLLSNATIGQHVRHILEFYICLLRSQENLIVNYDKRERNLELENNLIYAKKAIEKLIKQLNQLNENTDLFLTGNFSSEENDSLKIKTNLYRELAYCYEHSIHHQALIKIGLIDLSLENCVDDCFGVAPATLRYRSKITNKTA
jgi:uncharacterized damage-inducible protein DinB